MKHKLFKSTNVILMLFMALQGLFIAQPNHTAKAQGGTNLALGKAVFASSVQGANAASRVTDGLTSTAWSSTFAEPAWIYIDLDSAQVIEQVILIWEAAYGLEYQIEGSNDATTWTFLAEELHGDGGIDYISVTGTWRYIRMYGKQRGTGWGFSILEFQIFDVAQPVPPTEPYIPSLPFKPTSQLLFSDNFSAGNISQWQIVRGTWQVINGALTSNFPCSGGSAYMITAGDTTWTNYQLSLDVRRLAGYDPGGILIRNSASGYYHVDILPSLPYGGAVRIVKSTGATVQRSWPFNANTWYKLVIDVEGPVIDIYVVDVAQKAKLLLSYTDTNAPFLTGNIGFVAAAGALCPTQVEFDNIYVRQIEPSYLISGVIRNPGGDPISEVQLSANTSPISTMTKLDGSYTLGRFLPGTYTITPVKSDYSFSPASGIVNVPPNATNQDFTGQAITYSISGRVVDDSLNGLVGVTISDGGGHTAITNSSGDYILTGLAAGTYTLTASKSGNTFLPASRPVPVPPNATNQDFTLPFLDLPLSYAHTNFETATQGSNGGAGPGYVNSWFDHSDPGFGKADGNLITWQGPYLKSVYIDKTNCDTKPGGLGISCYDEHDGIDFRHASDEIFAAAPGTVVSAGLGSFGNQVFIDHHNCFATLYGHLKSIENNITANQPINDQQKIGIMGNTGLSIGNGDGTHLHFGVYFDPNCDGKWSDKVPIDPYPWRPNSTDPWPNVPNTGLWKYKVTDPTQVDLSGGQPASPGGTYSSIIPAGAISEPLTFELLPSPPVSEPSAQLHSTGYSFWMRVLEWLTPSNSTSTKLALSSTIIDTSATSFNTPVTVTIKFNPLSISHLDLNNMTIQQWDEIEQVWISLATNVDTINNQASAQTIQPGHFDLQGPLVCPADTLEPNDNYDASSVVQTDGTSVNNAFDIAQDEDWFQFDAEAARTYDLGTTNLSADVDTILEIYDTDGVTLLVSDDNSGGGNASFLSWEAPSSGVYFVRVRQASGSGNGCDATYDIRIAAIPDVFHKSGPANGATGQTTSLTLSWGTSSGAGSYLYCYDTTNDGACTNWIDNGASTSKTLSSLSYSTTYYWHVRATNGAGTRYAENSPTAFWSFKTRSASIRKRFTATVDDGWVLESTETSNKGGTMNATAATFNVGDAARDKQYRGILSFNTAGLPDNAVITAVTFKVRQQGVVGTNPFSTHGKLIMDMIKGAFSSNRVLQLTDFQAAASKNGLVAIPSTPSAGWYTKILPRGAFTYINKAGITQVRLRFALDDNDDLSADYLKFFSGNALAANRPQLIIQYYVP